MTLPQKPPSAQDLREADEFEIRFLRQSALRNRMIGGALCIAAFSLLWWTERAIWIGGLVAGGFLVIKGADESRRATRLKSNTQ